MFSEIFLVVLLLPFFVPLFMGENWTERILWAFTCLFLSYVGLALFLLAKSRKKSGVSPGS